MKTFRHQFSPIIASVIQDNLDDGIKELRRKLRRKWQKDVKTVANSYMVSEWSKEVKRQLQSHPDNQKDIKKLPLFSNMT